MVPVRVAVARHYFAIGKEFSERVLYLYLSLRVCPLMKRLQYLDIVHCTTGMYVPPPATECLKDPTNAVLAYPYPSVVMVMVPACLTTNRWEPLVKVLTGKFFR